MSFLIKNKIIFLVALLIADQASKLVALKNLILGQSISVFPYFDLTLVFNTGVAFSLFSGGGALAGRSGASAGRSALESSLRPVVCEEDN